jgi:hypothetical protein
MAAPESAQEELENYGEAEVPLPRIAIKFCVQCKWNLRAAYVCNLALPSNQCLRPKQYDFFEPVPKLCCLQRFPVFVSPQSHFSHTILFTSVRTRTPVHILHRHR